MVLKQEIYTTDFKTFTYQGTKFYSFYFHWPDEWFWMSGFG